MNRLFVLFAAILLYSCQPPSDSYDILLKNGTIVDGTGNPWFKADVAIKGDRIEAIGSLPNATARTVVDVSGLVVSPGFVDMLGQSEFRLLVDGRAMSKISQGVTTEITGEGGSAAPMNERTIAGMKSWMDRYNKRIDWTDFEDTSARWRNQRLRSIWQHL